MNKCEDCKYSKVKTTVMPDKEIVSERHCYFHIPRTEMVPTPRGLAQITFRPKVEDDDFCSEFSRKNNTQGEVDDIFGRGTVQAKDTSSSILVDSGGRSRDIPDGLQGRLP
jgi:hypothetical protein